MSRRISAVHRDHAVDERSAGRAPRLGLSQRKLHSRDFLLRFKNTCARIRRMRCVGGDSHIYEPYYSVGVEFEQDLSVAIGFQGSIDRLLEVIDRIHLLDRRG
jgi:hypothetical protein